MRFAISSNKDFANTTYRPCVSSLLRAGIPPNDIFWFEGNHEAYKQGHTQDGVHMIQVPHNSMDFNGLISILELGLTADRWFLLHDTCTVGKRFYRMVNRKYEHPVTALTNKGFSMNIGSYSHKHLQDIKPHLMMLKNTGNLDEYKAKLVTMEDCFLNPFKSFSYYTDKPPIVTSPVDLYGNGVPRIVHTYEDIDLSKSKANWEPKEKYELGL